MSKFGEIAKKMREAGSASPPPPKPTPARQKVIADPAPEPEPAPSSTYKAPSREGKVHLGCYLPPDFKRSLRLVQAQTGEDVQTLMARALNDLFRAHNVPVVDQD